MRHHLTYIFVGSFLGVLLVTMATRCADHAKAHYAALEANTAAMQVLTANVAGNSRQLAKLNHQEARALAGALGTEVAEFAGHASVACTSSGTALPAVPVANADGTLRGNAQKVTVHATSADIVRIVSKNGVAASQGTAFCTADGCVRNMTLPSPTSLWTCQADSTTATITLLGVR